MSKFCIVYWLKVTALSKSQGDCEPVLHLTNSMSWYH